MDLGCVVPGCVRPFYALGYCNAHYIAHRKYPNETPAQLATRSKRVRTPDEMRAHITAHLTETPSGCLEWTGSRDRRGYGNIRWDDRLWGAHRLTYHLFVAPVVSGLEVCHRCDNPPCCNVAHLYQGTHQQNMADAGASGVLSRNMTGTRNGRAAFTAEQVREIRTSPERGIDLAARFGVHYQTISDIRCYRRYLDVP